MSAPAALIGQGYELVYDVLKTGDSEPTSFFLDFEATDAATICIGLPDEDILQRAVLYQADFAGKTPLLTDGPLRACLGFPEAGTAGAAQSRRNASLR